MLYLDHNATTFIHPEVKKLMIDLANHPLNPSSVHTQGRYARNLVERAREQIKRSVAIDKNSKEYEVIFTSSGTESNNLIMHNYYNDDILISGTEHLSIFNHIKYKPDIKIIKTQDNGIINFESLEELLSQSNANRKLISVMLANNETGIIQDIPAISKIAKKYKAELHSDCVQALGKIEVDIQKLEIDFCTISAHKIGGIQGSSALIAKTPHHLAPMIIGGGQEKNLRSGTENVLGISCFGLAAEIAATNLQTRHNTMRELQNLLEQNLQKYKNVKIIGQDVDRLPNTSLIMIPKTEAQTKLIAFDLRDICISSGSACSSGKLGKSHVLTNMGVDDNSARSSLRVSFSYNQTLKDVETFVKAFEEIYSGVVEK